MRIDQSRFSKTINKLNDNMVAFISAYSDKYTEEENEVRSARLANEILKTYGYGYRVNRGYWRGTGEKGTYEKSFEVYGGRIKFAKFNGRDEVAYDLKDGTGIVFRDGNKYLSEEGIEYKESEVDLDYCSEDDMKRFDSIMYKLASEYEQFSYIVSLPNLGAFHIMVEGKVILKKWVDRTEDYLYARYLEIREKYTDRKHTEEEINAIENDEERKVARMVTEDESTGFTSLGYRRDRKDKKKVDFKWGDKGRRIEFLGNRPDEIEDAYRFFIGERARASAKVGFTLKDSYFVEPVRESSGHSRVVASARASALSLVTLRGSANGAGDRYIDLMDGYFGDVGEDLVSEGTGIGENGVLSYWSGGIGRRGAVRRGLANREGRRRKAGDKYMAYYHRGVSECPLFLCARGDDFSSDSDLGDRDKEFSEAISNYIDYLLSEGYEYSLYEDKYHRFSKKDKDSVDDIMLVYDSGDLYTGFGEHGDVDWKKNSVGDLLDGNIQLREWTSVNPRLNRKEMNVREFLQYMKRRDALLTDSTIMKSRRKGRSGKSWMD